MVLGETDLVVQRRRFLGRGGLLDVLRDVRDRPLRVHLDLERLVRRQAVEHAVHREGAGQDLGGLTTRSLLHVTHRSSQDSENIEAMWKKEGVVIHDCKRREVPTRN